MSISNLSLFFDSAIFILNTGASQFNHILCSIHEYLCRCLKWLKGDGHLGSISAHGNFYKASLIHSKLSIRHKNAWSVKVQHCKKWHFEPSRYIYVQLYKKVTGIQWLSRDRLCFYLNCSQIPLEVSLPLFCVAWKMVVSYTYTENISQEDEEV